jgi:putative colanic acid biosynthesis glycosyltransferase
MKILHLNTALSRGGAAYIAKTLVQGLNGLSGISAQLLHGQNNLKTEMFYGIQNNYTRYVNAGLYRIFGSPRIGIYSKEIANKIRSADIVHLHNLHGYWLNYSQLLDEIKKPVVWTWHDMWPATGRCGFSMDCDKWRIGCSSCPNKSFYPATLNSNSKYEFIEKTNYFNRANLKVVSPSMWLLNIATSRGVPSNNIHRISNPVDTKLFDIKEMKKSREILGIYGAEPILLFVANDCNDPRKGYVYFEEIINKMEVSGLVVGKPPRKKNDRIKYLGTVLDRVLLSHCYSASNCFLIPSIEDNFPTTVLESMACGTAVFGFRTGGIPEQLPKEWNGIVEKHDSIRLFETVEKYLVDEDEVKPITQVMMRNWVKKNSSIESVIQAYVQIYRSILA